MKLAIDIGNTRIKAAVFDGDRLAHKFFPEDVRPDTFEQHLYNHPVDSIIYSTVGPVIPEWPGRQVLELTHQTPLPIVNRYHTPETLGKDRLAAAVGAWALFPGHTCLVVDAGTCITTDVVSAAGEFLGGNIAPGIDMRLRAMHHFTARLPETPRGDTESWIGASTRSAIQNGAQLGALLELEGYIRLARQHFGKLKVLVTGGDAEFFDKTLKRKIFAHPDLVLVGLNKILEYNVVHHS